jgi:DNA-binding beta-propeller fold protein YncE
MNNRIKQIFSATAFLMMVTQLSAQTIISPPAGNMPTEIHKDGKTIIPNGRILTPHGSSIMVAPHPYGMVLSPDGNTLVTSNSGTSPLSITIIRNVRSNAPEVQQIPPNAYTDKGILASVFMGLAISPDNKTVFVAGGQENKIYLFDLATGKSTGTISCSHKTDSTDYSNGYIGDLVLNKAGDKLYAVDQIGFRLVVVDVPLGKVIHSVRTGRYPFGIALSPNEKTVYVANVGMYEYKLLENIDPKNPRATAMTFPPFSYLSPKSEKGIYNDSIQLPGLGDPLSDEAFSVWSYDVSKPIPPVVTSKVKTGFQIGELIEDIPAVGGASPNSIVASDKYVFVSNGTNDCISVLNAQTHKLIKNIKLSPDLRLGQLKGVIPFGLSLSPDQKTLYVAESGINAVAIISTDNFEVKGHFPVGWFPSKLAVSSDGKTIYVANAKGFGSGPNGGRDFNPGPEGSNIGRLMKGFVSICPVPTVANLADLTKKVVDNNFLFRSANDTSFYGRKKNPIPLYPGASKSPILYWVFIPKENRTYDEVLGQLSFANGDSTIARFGVNIPLVTSPNRALSVTNATVMPNHLALAKQFAFSDNFYCDADHSSDGHRWLVDTYPNEWTESTTSAGYGGNRNMKGDVKLPGTLSLTSGTSAIYPEDYNEAGSIWDHFERNKIRYFNFGLGLGFGSRFNDTAFNLLTVKYQGNYPMPGKLEYNSSRIFPVFNTTVPDQYRADVFIKEVEERWRKPGRPLPSVMTVRIANDHGGDVRADYGYPFRESFMADNDLAIGRVIEYLSHTPYWKNMAIVITEDDPQGGVDHVDAHRSILMVASPFAKKHYAGHVHYSFGSFFKTLWNSLGISYLNQYDAGAADFDDLFTSKPDYTPYNALPSDLRIFDPQKALTPLDKKFDWKAFEKGGEFDHPSQMLKDSKELDEYLKKQKKSKQ